MATRLCDLSSGRQHVDLHTAGLPAACRRNRGCVGRVRPLGGLGRAARQPLGPGQLRAGGNRRRAGRRGSELFWRPECGARCGGHATVVVRHRFPERVPVRVSPHGSHDASACGRRASRFAAWRRCNLAEAHCGTVTLVPPGASISRKGPKNVERKPGDTVGRDPSVRRRRRARQAEPGDPAGGSAGRPRSERRREDHRDRAPARYPARAGGRRARIRKRSGRQGGASAPRGHVAGLRGCRHPHRDRAPRAVRQLLPDAAPGLPTARHGRSGGTGRTALRPALRRPEAARDVRAGAGRRSGAGLPGRADDRSRRRGAPQPVERDPGTACGGPDRRAHHALPGGGRRPGRPDRGRPPGTDRRRGDASTSASACRCPGWRRRSFSAW